MGYSHYYYQKRSMTHDEFELFKGDINKLAEVLVELGHSAELKKRYERWSGKFQGAPVSTAIQAQGPGLGTGGAIVGVDTVGFNGAGGLGCETFFVAREIRGHVADYELADIKREGQRFYGVKTRQRTYDVLVCAALLCLIDRAPDAWRVSSDGEIEDWAVPARFASSVLARQVPLDRVSNFGETPELVGAALAPTAWMLSVSERPDIEKAAGNAGENRPRRTL